jgi:quercetin dioxygenase-like cupin family protein
MLLPERDSTEVTAGTRDPNLKTPGGIRTFDLAVEGRDLAQSGNPECAGRTIARLETLRLTLMSLKSGARVDQHQSEHEVSIHTVSGHVVLHTPNGRIDLPAGVVAVLERHASHDIVARSDSAILITVCMSPSTTTNESR